MTYRGWTKEKNVTKPEEGCTIAPPSKSDIVFFGSSRQGALDICSEATGDSAHGAWNTGGARWDGQSQSEHISRSL